MHLKHNWGEYLYIGQERSSEKEKPRFKVFFRNRKKYKNVVEFSKVFSSHKRTLNSIYPIHDWTHGFRSLWDGLANLEVCVQKMVSGVGTGAYKIPLTLHTFWISYPLL